MNATETQWPKVHHCSVGPYHGQVCIYLNMTDFRARTTPNSFQPGELDLEHRDCMCGGTLTAVSSVRMVPDPLDNAPEWAEREGDR